MSSARRAQVRRPPWWGDEGGAVADARPWSAGARVLHPRSPPPPAGVAGRAGHGNGRLSEAEQRALADEYAEEVRQRKAASLAATSVQAISRGNRARSGAAMAPADAEQRALADEYAQEQRQRKAASLAAVSVQAISRGNRARAKSG